MKRSISRAVLFVAFLSLAGVNVRAAQAATAWTGTGDATNWSDPSNWSAGSPVPGSDVQFDSTPTNSNTVMDLGSITINSYEQPLAGGTHQWNLVSSTLTTGDFLLTANPSGSNGIAHLTVQGNVGSLLHVTGALSMGNGRDRNTSLTIDPNVALQIGTSPASRGSLTLIDTTSASFATNIASLVAGETFNAYLTNMHVGAELGANYGDLRNSRATLDLSNVTTGSLDISQNLLVGEGFGMTGTVTVSDAINVKVGVDSANRGALRVASGGAKVETHLASTLTLGSGTLQAYLTELSVGHATEFSNSSGANNYSATGTLDASNVSDGFINVAGAVRVGTNVTGVGRNTSQAIILDPTSAPRGVGTLRLSDIDVSAFSLQVGDEDNVIMKASVQGNAGRGTLELGGTRFFVRDSVIVDGFDAANAGLVSIDVNGEAAGLILSSDATLSVGEGLIDITFAAPELNLTQHGINYFGLSWEGDHVAELLGLGSKLTWDDSDLIAAGFDPVSIYFLDGFTYVGIYMAGVPEPNSGILLAVGLLPMLRRRLSGKTTA